MAINDGYDATMTTSNDGHDVPRLPPLPAGKANVVTCQHPCLHLVKRRQIVNYPTLKLHTETLRKCPVRSHH